tara:strand:+ start:98 stop:616 length:519 start_codon:yes stop_codon:yes gene_type:complete
MPTLIVKLQYAPPVSEIKTEEQLERVFTDLNEAYLELAEHQITRRGNPVTNFGDFLRIAVQPQRSVVVYGDGNICGLIVEDGYVEYDLSRLGELVRFWDQRIDGSCHSCTNFQQNPMWGKSCGVEEELWKDECPGYNAKIQNSQGGAALPLAGLVERHIEKDKIVYLQMPNP